MMITRPMHVEDIVIESNSFTLMEQLRQFYGTYAQPVEKESPTFTIIENENETLIIHPTGTTKCVDALLFMSDYLFEHTIIQEGFFVLHGGAVGYNGKAYVLAAPTGSGKTTLTAWLVQNGFSYITDDSVIIEKSNLHVHPYCKPLHLREGGMKILEGMGMEMSGSVRISRAKIDRYIWHPFNAVTEPVPLDGIFFIERIKSLNTVEEVSLGKSINRLMKSPITHFAVNSEYLSFLAKLAGVGCHVIEYSDMSFVADTLREVAELHG